MNEIPSKDGFLLYRIAPLTCDVNDTSEKNRYATAFYVVGSDDSAISGTIEDAAPDDFHAYCKYFFVPETPSFQRPKKIYLT